MATNIVTPGVASPDKDEVEHKLVIDTSLPSTEKRCAGTHIFSFRKICFSVPVKQKGDRLFRKTGVKKIIDNVSATVSSGHVLAILGPSGAGKTSLINTLTLNSFGGKCTGTVQLNGRNLTPNTLVKYGFVCPQQDRNWCFLTCRETLLYAAELYLDTSAEERETRVETVISKMGLAGCADTRVGNEFLQGLSGGQKRRLSIAVALIKRPRLIFLDEPTSGLDAAAAAKIMEFITDLAAKENLIIVATIHQPSTAVYNRFDEIMILSAGRTAYCGPSKDAVKYFAEVGHAIPQYTNPAEFFLDLVNADFVDEKHVTKLLDTWQQKEAQYLRDPSKFPSTPKQVDAATGVGLCKQIGVMLRRHSVLMIRDPTLYVGRCLIFLIACCFFAVVYIESRNRTQPQAINRVWLIVWLLGFPANLGVVATFAYNTEYKAIRREVKNGMVSSAAYLFANTVLQLPWMFLFGVFSLGAAGYGIGDWYGPHFGLVLIVYAFAIYCWEAFAQYFSVQFENPLMGMMSFMNIWFSAFLFGGFLVPPEEVVWPLRVLTWVLPLKYAVRSTTYLEIGGDDWEPCDLSDATSPCYHPNGTAGKVLDGLGQAVFPLFKNEDTVAEDVGLMAAITLVLKVSFLVLFVVNCNKFSKLKKPSTTKETEVKLLEQEKKSV